jgi:hypothetical protein
MVFSMMFPIDVLKKTCSCHGGLLLERESAHALEVMGWMLKSMAMGRSFNGIITSPYFNGRLMRKF